MQVISHIQTLTRLHLDCASVAFTEAGARELSHLQKLQHLSLSAQRRKPMDMGPDSKGLQDTFIEIEEKATQHLNSLPSLTRLALYNVHLPDFFGTSFAVHPLLSRLNLHCSTTVNAVQSLIIRSSSLSEIYAFVDRRPILRYLQNNTHILRTNLFLSANEGEQWRHEARNRRLLHNWQCISVLLASYRANEHSVIRDSILSLMTDIMCFLLPDDWYIERRH
jgi:hypothetical protein